MAPQAPPASPSPSRDPAAPCSSPPRGARPPGEPSGPAAPPTGPSGPRPCFRPPPAPPPPPGHASRGRGAQRPEVARKRRPRCKDLGGFPAPTQPAHPLPAGPGAPAHPSPWWLPSCVAVARRPAPSSPPPASPGRTAQARACADAVTDARPGPATWAGKGSSSLAETGSVCVREGPATGKAPPPGCQGRIEVLGVGGRVTGLARARTRSKELPSQKLLFGLGHFLSVGSSYRLHQVGLHLENETETD